MTAFETMKEEEDKILTPLFLITDPWLWALVLYKPLDSSWCEKQFLRPEPTVLPRELKATFLFPPDSVSMFFIRLQGAEKAKILSSNTTRILRILWKPAAQ